MKSTTTPETALDQLTATVSLQRLAESRSVKLRRRKDGTLTGTCPFHAGSRARKRHVVTLDPRANTWACGSCRMKSGTVVEWTMRSEGVSRRHAIELLRQDFGSAKNSKVSKAKKASTSKLDTFIGDDDPNHVVMDRVLDYYNETLKQSPEALAYLKERGLVHGELLDTFRLGYSNRTLGYRLPAKNRKQGFQLRGQLERIGIYRSTGHELFWGALVIPVLDEHGQVADAYGRKILGDRRLKPGTPLHLWLPGPRRGVFNILAVKASSDLVITDSLINALTFWVHDIRNVTAALGAEHFRDVLVPAMQRHGTKRVHLALRRTKEGEQQAEDFGDQLAGLGIEVFEVVFPMNMDANDYARSVEHPRDALQQAVRSAQWVAGKARPAIVPTAIAETRAAPAPTTAPEPLPTADHDADEVVLQFGDRRWRIRGLRRNTSFEAMRVNVLVSRANGHPLGHGFHADVLELYSARQRAAFTREAADELGLDEQAIKHDLGRVLLELEQVQDQIIRAELEPKDKPVEMSEEDREQALQLLRDPRLLDRVVEDLERCGLVGETTNKVVAYLATISRKLTEPLAIVVQSSSAAGKTSLMDAVLSFVPEEERASFSAMTGQSLFYMGTTELAHKVLAISEEAGAKRSAYALKLLQSEGEISIASTGKDPGTGRLVTQEYRVQGPVMLFMTTTSLDLDPELANRCVVLSVDETREQTAAIHELQRHRQTLKGLLGDHDREAIVKLHQDAQRLLRPVHVVNPFASELRFNAASTRSRRDHAKFLTLIKAVTLLHQHQRPNKTVEHRGHKIGYIEVTQGDVDLATKLAAEVIHGDDDLPPTTRKVLDAITTFVTGKATELEVKAGDVKFTQRELREHVGLGHSQLKVHLARLVELEHLVVHAGGPRRRFVYGYDASWPVETTSGRSLAGPLDRPDSRNDPEPVSDLADASATARPGKRSRSASYSQIRK